MVRDRDPLQNLPRVEGDAEEVTVYEPTSAEWVIAEWVTLDRELHPFGGSGRLRSLVAQIAISILKAAAGELVIVDDDVGETIHRPAGRASAAGQQTGP